MSEDVDDLRATIRAGIYADDRATQHEIDDALTALNRLTKLAALLSDAPTVAIAPFLKSGDNFLHIIRGPERVSGTYKLVAVPVEEETDDGE